MAVNTKAIKTRIKSVQNTKKITRAMEMVSAAKMRKAIEATLGARLYATLAAELMNRLSELQEPNFPLFEKREVKKVLMILVSSNRGLCGSFNSNMFKAATQLIDDKENLGTHRNGDQKHDTLVSQTMTVDVLGIGRKSALFAKRNKLELVSIYEDLGENPDMEDTRDISRFALEKFTDTTYDKVVVVYTHFKSSLEQTVKVRQLLPISKHDVEKMVEREKHHVLPQEENSIETYFMEPTREAILEEVLPRLVEVQLYQAVLESAASEHSARMVAMKNASESANDMITDLTLVFNKARQAAITQEIAEIAGGAAALE